MGGNIINRKILFLALMFSIALFMNFGCVAATNSTNTSLNNNNTTSDQINIHNLSLAEIKVGLKWTQNYYIVNDKLPNYVYYGTAKIPIATFLKILSSHGLKIETWVKVKNLKYYHQTTQYTCGPSSLKMVFSNYGLNLPEMRLAYYGGSASNFGTTTAGMLNAVKDVNLKYNTKFKAWDSSFISLGWKGLEKYIAHNEPVILHIRFFYILILDILLF